MKRSEMTKDKEEIAQEGNCLKLGSDSFFCSPFSSSGLINRLTGCCLMNSFFASSPGIFLRMMYCNHRDRVFLSSSPPF